MSLEHFLVVCVWVFSACGGAYGANKGWSGVKTIVIFGGIGAFLMYLITFHL